MKTFDLGTGVACNLELLIETRMLIQAQSGGGKTTALRRILEQTHGQVQHLVIDPEGEFSTLREQFDYVLAARSHGETVAHPRSAALVAHRLLELGASAILDIYELKAPDRVEFVRRFLEALVEAPRALRHPVLVVIDEAHVFCPEKGQAESAPAVIDLCARGRKRGLCPILATQRLSKLHKDAAAELRNVLVGATGLDIDQQRAGDVLGFGKAERLALRDLKWREFFAYGPALSPGVVKVTIGATKTKNPPTGRAMAPPPPTAKIKALLPQLADLPAEAEQRQRSFDDLKKDNAQLRRELTIAQRAQPAPAPAPAPIEVPVLTPEMFHRAESLLEQAVALVNDLSVVRRELDPAVTTLREAVESGRIMAARVSRPSAVAATPSPPPLARAVPPRVQAAPSGRLTGPQQAILDTVLMLNVRSILATRDSVARWLGIHPNGGSYGANLGRLRAEGYLEGFMLTPPGSAAAHPQPTGFDALLQALDEEPKRRILRVLDESSRPLSREELAAVLNLHPNGGSYGANLGWLRTMGVITERGPIALTEGARR